ncbi:hypothetical protein C8J57DRAFT_1230678 [Mycena rebaudengoi]|nr:hypothetical protein C8J57DRAFT_1230678 [Mycena rebaudengoi]
MSQNSSRGAHRPGHHADQSNICRRQRWSAGKQALFCSKWRSVTTRAAGIFRAAPQTIVQDTIALPSAVPVERPKWGSVTTRAAGIFKAAPQTIVRDTVALPSAVPVERPPSPQTIVRDTIALPSAVPVERRLLKQVGIGDHPRRRDFQSGTTDHRPGHHCPSLSGASGAPVSGLSSGAETTVRDTIAILSTVPVERPGGNERRSKAPIFGAAVGGEDVLVAWVWPPPPDCELEDLDESRALHNVKRHGLRISRGSTDASLQSGGEIVSGTAATAATKRDKSEELATRSERGQERRSSARQDEEEAEEHSAHEARATYSRMAPVSPPECSAPASRSPPALLLLPVAHSTAKSFSCVERSGKELGRRPPLRRADTPSTTVTTGSVGAPEACVRADAVANIPVSSIVPENIW